MTGKGKEREVEGLSPRAHFYAVELAKWPEGQQRGASKKALRTVFPLGSLVIKLEQNRLHFQL